VRRLLVALALLTSCPASGREPTNAPMTFGLYQPTNMIQLGDTKESCTGICTVTAEGKIVADTPERFRAFLEKEGVKGGTVLFNSNGGDDLAAAIELGREIRKHGFDTSLPEFFTASPLPKYCSELAPRTPARKDNLQNAQAEMARAVELLIACTSRIGTISTGRCLSACAYAYLGGVVRSLGRPSDYAGRKVAYGGPEFPDIFGSARTEQWQIGFHEFKPGMRLDASPDEQFSAGATYAQQIFPDLSRYVSDMGISPKLFEWATRRSKSDDPVFKDFYFPSVAELADVGILPEGHFLPFELVIQKDRVMWVSRYSNGLLWEKQVALLCVRRDGAAPSLGLIVSGGVDGERRPGPGKPLRLDNLGSGPSPVGDEAKTSGRFGALRGLIRWNSEDSWRIDVGLDGAPLHVAGHLSTKGPQRLHPDANMRDLEKSTEYIEFFDVSTGWLFHRANTPMSNGQNLNHYLIPLPDSFIAQLATAKRLALRYRLSRTDTAAIEFPENLAESLDFLMRSCLSVSKPADHVTERRSFRI
jgi:hypothetical protein